MSRLRRAIVFAAVLGASAGAAAQPARDDSAPYRVECVEGEPCRADLATFVGWRVFQAQCATCHAADARGSRFAPDLLERMRSMTRRSFFAALDQGYLGPQSTMPPRGRDPNVSPYYEELWSFLRARIAGALPPGPVERLRDSPEAAP